MCYVTCVFIPRQRNDGHLDFTNQSPGNYFELCQLLFKSLVLSEPVSVVYGVIESSLANQTDKNFWIQISPRLTIKNDAPYEVCNKCLLWSLSSNDGNANENERHFKINTWEMVTILGLLLLPRILCCWQSMLQVDWYKRRWSIDLLLCAHIVVKTFNLEISRYRLADYVKEFR